MKRLSRELLRQGPALAPSVACNGPASRPERLVQFGEGNFLRAFAGWMVDLLNEQGLFNGSIVVLQPIPHGRVEDLQAQDGLYTVVLRGVQDGARVESRRLVTAVSRALNPYTAWEEAARCFRHPGLRFVISNTTEAGIVFRAEAHRPGQCPESFPAKVTALLFERFKATRGGPAGGLVFLPCELIDRNGDTLCRCVLQHAEAWGLGPEFAAWVSADNHFLNTLVDRIVPGHPREEAETLARELGYEDKLLVAGEVFHLWVIEGPPGVAEELPFHRAGLNVVWTDDLAPYRTRKVRVLNGAHTASVLAAFHAGLDTVRGMVEDPLLGRFVRRVVFDEILPNVPLPEPDKADYARSVLERFANPFVRHELLAIALNSVSKWRVRVLPSLLDHLQATGRLPPLLGFSLAALLRFYQGRRAESGEFVGARGDTAYAIRDEPTVLDFMAAAWLDFERHRDPGRLVARVLGAESLWGQDLNRVAGLTQSITRHLGEIQRHGLRDVLTPLLA
jgi:tagaturonate reductase